SAVATAVSVVLPASEAGPALDAAIAAVLAQDHAALELLVIGAPDGSVRARDRRLRLLPAPPGGVAAWRQAGLAAATGALVAHIAPGDRWRPDFLSLMTAWLAADELDCGCCAVALTRAGAVAGYLADQVDPAAPEMPLAAIVHRRAVATGLGPLRDSAFLRHVLGAGR